VPRRSASSRRIRACRRAAVVASAFALALLAPPARALVLPPVTLDGPNADLLDVGGVAIAPDGTGGVVYTEAVDGVPHVFASRFAVDRDRPYDASWPRIAAGDGGRLLVVWVTQMATVHTTIQRGLVSAALDRGARSFGPSLIVDSDVGAGAGVSPSLAGADSGQAIVAYRVVTNDFSTATDDTSAVQLRRGDVMADVRLARLNGPTWARIGAINRAPFLSTRPPSATNGPQVAAGPDGNAVVTWQESDQSGTARIWMRRVFGTVPGPALEASPTSWDGRPVTDDADAFALAGTDFEQARVAMRVAGGSGSALGGPRIFLTTLPSSLDDAAGTPQGPLLADGGGDRPPAGGVGAPAVAAVDDGANGLMRLAFTTGGALRLSSVDDAGALVPLPASGPAAAPNAMTATAVDPEGGGVTAWSALDARGAAVVAVREDFASGAAQTGILAGTDAGPVSELSIGRADSGDALLAFRQGDAGHVEIVVDRVTVPPAHFGLETPADWVPPRRAAVRWDPAPSSVGGITYSVLLDGRPVARRLTHRRYVPGARLLGDGVRRVQVLATDALGQSLLSPALALDVDARPPRVSVAPARGRASRLPALPRSVVVHVVDRESGLNVRDTTCDFGDDSRRVRGHSAFRHRYARGGRFLVVVNARDRVGNRTTRHLWIEVR
jgi:hypothetical protein